MSLPSGDDLKPRRRCTSYKPHYLAMGLELNDAKTRIVQLPDMLEDLWMVELHSVGPEDLFSLFSRAFELVTRFPDKSVVRYAIAMTSRVEIDSERWTAYQNILLQCAASEPGTLRYVLAELDRAEVKFGMNIDRLGLRELCISLISIHAPLGHGSEIAWALWTAIRFDVSLPSELLQELVSFSDPFVPVLCLHAQDCGCVLGNRVDMECAWNTTIDDGLNGTQWLFAYEGRRRGWLTQDTLKGFERNELLEWLYKRDVSFFIDDAPVDLINPWRGKTPYGEPADVTSAPTPNLEFPASA